MSLRDNARSLGLGRAAYLLWHVPAGIIKRSAAAGGPIAQWRNARGAAAMARAACGLPTAQTAPDPAGPEVHFLTGRQFWYQTAFCLHTLQVHSERAFRAVIHDDGTLDPVSIDRLRKLFPGAKILTRAEDDARVARVLPASRYPALHAERARPYPNFRKLTDVHAGEHGWRLVLDSDMLFFRRPDELLGWMARPDRPIWMHDVKEAYGYPVDTMADLAGAAIPRQVNVGVCGINGTGFDWDQLEHWTRALRERHGSSYYLEQALSAMWFAGRSGAALPASDYIVFPGDTECRSPRAVLHHYVAGSKRGYFRLGWRAAVERSLAVPAGAPR